MSKYAVEGLNGYPNELAHKLDESEATATRRLELLSRLEWSRNKETSLSSCPICERYNPANVNYLGLADTLIGHAADCRLAKELKDE